MSHAFIPPNTPGHENTPLWLQLVANHIMERLVMFHGENLLQPPQSDLYDYLCHKGIVQNWDLFQGLPRLVGVLSLTNRWLYYGLRDVVDLVLAVHAAEGRPLWHFLSGYVSFTLAQPFTLGFLRDVCAQTRVFTVSYEDQQRIGFSGQYGIDVCFPLSERWLGLEAKVEEAVQNEWPCMGFTALLWPDRVIECIDADNEIDVCHTWSDLSEKLDAACLNWQTEPFVKRIEPYDSATLFSVHTRGTRVRYTHFMEFCRALIANGCTIEKFNVENDQGLPPSLFGKRV